MIIHHQLLEKDFFIPSWKINHLFLGTFNPCSGEEVAYFYGRQKNYTWTILSEIFDEDFNRNNISDLLRKLQKHQIACMDMIRSVDATDEQVRSINGEGYKDSKIINNKVKRDYNTNFINEVIRGNKDIKVYSTWGIGPSINNWHQEVAKVNSSIINLVSPSPAARVPKGTKKYPYVFNSWKSLIK